MIRYAISCLGCKVNTYEAESVSASLKKRGYQEVNFKDEADIYCIFTCAVTNTAASKSRQKIHQAIRQNPDAVICAIGCYVQLSAEAMAQEEHIDILVGSSNKMKLVEYIEEVLEKKKRIIKVEDVRNNIAFEALEVDRFEHKTRAFLKIQDGCNQFCSYCIIPYARGAERSLNYQEVLKQAQTLSMHHQEIVLTGIHTGRYRSESMDLAQLIKLILDNTSIKRIRISSIEMNEINEELIELIKNEPRVAKHLHIPLQSGCDATLLRMNRPYTTAQFLKLIKRLKEEVDAISISTDIIVGFPNETQEEYEATKAFLSQVKFSFIHVFPFSSKDNTKAAQLSHPIENKVKKQRVKELLSFSKQCKIEYESKFINATLQVLIESCEVGCSFGYTSEYIYVKIEKEYPVGSIVDVVATHMIHYELIAKG